MAMIQRLTNTITRLFGFKQVDNNYDFRILVQLLTKLPEDVLIEILLRLPADVLVLLCPIWRNLIASPLFIDLHLKRADSLYIVQYEYQDGCDKKTKLSIVDCTTRKCMDLVSHHVTYELNCSHRSLWASCRGLLAFQNSYKVGGGISIVNPITGENRDISTPKGLNNTFIYGFFFDRFRGRYKLLYFGRRESNINNVVYYTFDLFESVWRKLHSKKYCSKSRYRTNSQYPGVVVGDALHWIADWPPRCYCSKMIVVFKIETEEFYSLPHPPVTNGGNSISAANRSDDYCCIHSSFMGLIAKDGQLCFSQIIAEERAVDLWILEDYENGESWVKKFRVNLVSINKNFRRMTESNMHIFLGGLRLGSPRNGSNEILVTCIYSSWKGFYGYHLETHHSWQLQTRLPKGHYDYGYVVFPYTKTMLSPMFKKNKKKRRLKRST